MLLLLLLRNKRVLGFCFIMPPMLSFLLSKRRINFEHLIAELMRVQTRLGAKLPATVQRVNRPSDKSRSIELRIMLPSRSYTRQRFYMWLQLSEDFPPDKSRIHAFSASLLATTRGLKRNRSFSLK